MLLTIACVRCDRLSVSLGIIIRDHWLRLTTLKYFIPVIIYLKIPMCHKEYFLMLANPLIENLAIEII